MKDYISNPNISLIIFMHDNKTNRRNFAFNLNIFYLIQFQTLPEENYMLYFHEHYDMYASTHLVECLILK